MVGAVEGFETPPSSLSNSSQRVSSEIGFHLHPKVHHASSLTGMRYSSCDKRGGQARHVSSQRRNERESYNEHCFLCAVPLSHLDHLPTWWDFGSWGRTIPPVPTVQGCDLRQSSTSYTPLQS